MPWQAITADQALAGFSPQERGFLANTFGSLQAVSDAAATIVTDEVSALQGAVIAGGGRQGPVGTTPDQLRPDVLAIIRWRLLLTYPSLKLLQTDARKAAFDTATDKITKVANGDLKVELPDSATAQNNRAPVDGIQVASADRRQFTRKGMKGL